MGNAAEICASENGFGRLEQDDYAIKSYTRAQEASNSGRFEKEIVPVVITTRGKQVVVGKDEECQNVFRD